MKFEYLTVPTVVKCVMKIMYNIFIDFIGYRPIFAIFICFLLLGNGKISLMIITPSAANRLITNSLSHLFVKCCITNVLCVYKLPLCLTIFYSYSLALYTILLIHYHCFVIFLSYVHNFTVILILSLLCSGYVVWGSHIPFSNISLLACIFLPFLKFLLIPIL